MARPDSLYIDRMEIMKRTGMSRGQVIRQLAKYNIKPIELKYFEQKKMYLREDFEKNFPLREKDNDGNIKEIVRQSIVDEIKDILDN